MPMMTLESPFTFGERVIIDGDTSLVARVTKFSFSHPDICEIMVSWVHNGAISESWISNWRLSPAPE